MNPTIRTIRTIIGVFAAVIFVSGLALAGTDSIKAPTGLKAAAGEGGAITLAWDAVKGAESYNIYMASRPGVTVKGYRSLADAMTHSAKANSFTHPGPGIGKTYYFAVTAVGPGGESGESAEVFAPAGGAMEKKARRGWGSY
ncbi:MAG: fibronectin type III domain-containing protein [Nitrospinae bacterium]|nr:fibronectin type III domain-containing protein [Nitrospinota bacterium]